MPKPMPAASASPAPSSATMSAWLAAELAESELSATSASWSFRSAPSGPSTASSWEFRRSIAALSAAGEGRFDLRASNALTKAVFCAREATARRASSGKPSPSPLVAVSNAACADRTSPAIAGSRLNMNSFIASRSRQNAATACSVRSFSAREARSSLKSL